MVSVAFTDTPLAAAVIVAVVDELTLDVLTLNVVDVFPAGTVTDAGTLALELPLDN